MISNIVSWDGHNINDGTVFEAWIPEDSKLAGGYNQPVFVTRSQNWPKTGTVILQPYTIPLSISIQGDIDDGWNQILQWFDPSTPISKKLIAKDENDTEWYLYATVTQIIRESAVEALVTLSVDGEVYWQEEDLNSQTWAVNSTGSTTVVTISGSKPARPIFEITPQTTRSSDGYSFRKHILLYNNLSKAFVNYPLEITGGGLDTQALVTAGKMQSGGNDLRLKVDGVEVNRWVTGINTTGTKVWINLNLSPKIELTLRYAIPSTGDFSTITFLSSTANKKLIKSLPDVGMLQIDNEIFTYTSKNVTKLTVNGVIRATHDTSSGAHLVGATCRWIEHEIYLLYGNSASTAPVVDDTLKPILDLTNSTNTSWVFTEFADDAGKRSAIWKGTVLKTGGKQSTTYTGSHTADADPATEMGMSIKAWEKSGRWQSETASIEWRLSHPAGITTVTSNGAKYRFSASWPNKAALQRSSNGTSFADVWNEATPSSASSWEAFTQAGISLGSTYNHIRFLLDGSVTATASNIASFEVQGVTLTLNGSNVPSITLGSEIASYYLNCTILNLTTEESLSLTWPMTLNNTITVNGEEKTVTYSGVDAYASLSFDSPRIDWLNLLVGANNLQFVDSGTGTALVLLKWRNRSA